MNTHMMELVTMLNSNTHMMEQANMLNSAKPAHLIFIKYFIIPLQKTHLLSFGNSNLLVIFMCQLP